METLISKRKYLVQNGNTYFKTEILISKWKYLFLVEMCAGDARARPQRLRARVLPQPGTLNPQSSTLNPQPSTLNPQP